MGELPLDGQMGQQPTYCLPAIKLQPTQFLTKESNFVTPNKNLLSL